MAWLIAFWLFLGLGVWMLIQSYPGALAATGNREDLVYLTILLVVIGSSVLASFRGRLAQALRYGLIWLLVLAGLLTAYAWRDEASLAAKRVLATLVPSEPVQSGEHEVSVRIGPDGHFRVWAEIEGERVEFVIDTGASTIALTEADATRIGLTPSELNYNQPVITANGRAMTAGTRLESVTIGPIIINDVATRVMRGASLDRSLLGMSFLSRLSSVELSGSKLVLRQ